MMLLVGDCRQIMPAHAPFDMIVADQPYGDTALKWDRRVEAWHGVAKQCLKLTGSLWVFGSLRYFIANARHFEAAGLKYAQEIVWRKPNGTGMAADRFKRVHELVVQFYRRDAKWADVYNDVQRVPAVTGNKSVKVRQADRIAHAGRIRPRDYHDDGTRIMKSVVEVKSVRGGLHRTEKPVDLLTILIRTSCPVGGIVGDFFAGSGAVGEAASRIGRAYIGCEIDPLMAARAQARLASLISASGLSGAVG